MAQPKYKANLQTFCMRNNVDAEKVMHHVAKTHTWFIDGPTENAIVLCGRKTSSNRSTSNKIGSLSKMMTFGEENYIIIKTATGKVVVVCWKNFSTKKSTTTFNGVTINKCEAATDFVGKSHSNHFNMSILIHFKRKRELLITLTIRKRSIVCLFTLIYSLIHCIGH